MSWAVTDDAWRAQAGWTRAEEASLRTMFHQGYGDTKIARLIGRTARAVANKRDKLGLTRRRLGSALRRSSDEELIAELDRRGYDVAKREAEPLSGVMLL